MLGTSVGNRPKRALVDCPQKERQGHFWGTLPICAATSLVNSPCSSSHTCVAGLRLVSCEMPPLTSRGLSLPSSVLWIVPSSFIAPQLRPQGLSSGRCRSRFRLPLDGINVRMSPWVGTVMPVRPILLRRGVFLPSARQKQNPEERRPRVFISSKRGQRCCWTLHIK